MPSDVEHKAGMEHDPTYDSKDLPGTLVIPPPAYTGHDGQGPSVVGIAEALPPNYPSSEPLHAHYNPDGKEPDVAAIEAQVQRRDFAPRTVENRPVQQQQRQGRRRSPRLGGIPRPLIHVGHAGKLICFTIYVLIVSAAILFSIVALIYLVAEYGDVLLE